MDASTDGQRTPNILEQISTRWPLITDPGKFFLRYAPAIQRYLGAILRDRHAVEEVTQELILRLLEKQIAPEQVQRGRFRDYLKAVVRNAALSHLRREQARPSRTSEGLDQVSGREEDPMRLAERTWNEQWRDCLLDRVWDNLDGHERENPASRCCTVLRLRLAHLDDDTTRLAERLSQRIGETVRPDAFRKQLSRARRTFARYLLREVAQTLEQPTARDIEDELRDLGLLDALELLPEDWRERGDLLDL
ncbi:MAG: sigma-70 family RNA polymerase sigma factor [Gemmataceae bacterium]